MSALCAGGGSVGEAAAVAKGLRVLATTVVVAGGAVGGVITAWTSESNRATGNAFYLSPSPTARNHMESGPSRGRTNQHNSEPAALGLTAARPAPEPACDATKHLRM